MFRAINIKLFNSDSHQHIHFNSVAKNWNELQNSVVIEFNIENFKDQLDDEETSSITDEYVRYAC